MLLYTYVMEGMPRNAKRERIEIDEALFPRIAAGDDGALAELYSLTHKAIYAFALSILKHSDDAYDVTSDTYLRIRAAAGLYERMGKPLAWIFTIARNLAMTTLRRRKAVELTQTEEIENSLKFSVETDRLDQMTLKAALTILSEEEREIILMHAVSGYRHHEIASALSKPLSTVLSKYHRGLKKLRKYLEDVEAAT